jgi:hypothetical protein
MMPGARGNPDVRQASDLAVPDRCLLTPACMTGTSIVVPTTPAPGMAYKLSGFAGDYLPLSRWVMR